MSGALMRRRRELLATMTSGGGGGGVVQSGFSSSSTLASTTTATLTATSSSGNSIFVWGFIACSVAGASVTLAVTDDKSNTWTVDATADPGGGNLYKVFAASCLTPATGTKVITITATGGTICGYSAWAEVSTVTGRLTPAATHGSSGSNQVTPITITRSGANSSPHAFAVHAFTMGGYFSSSFGISASSTSGTLTQVVVNQDSTGNPAPGYAGYLLDTTTVTDSATDAWTIGTATIGQVLCSYSMS